LRSDVADVADVADSAASKAAKLRAATRRAIQDPAFRQIFDSPQTVAATWPVQT